MGLVTDTTATQKGEDKALHTEKAVWTSKRSRGALRTRHKHIIEHQEKPQWLDGEIKLRNKPLAVEERRVRKAADLKKPGAAKAGEPPGESDVELEKHEPKPKPQPKPWGPMNRKVHEEHPRGHLGVFEGDFGGCEDKDRKAGVMACFMNPTKTRKNKHYWCVCDRAQDGNWVNTQGNHSDHSASHPNALKPGFALSSTNKQYVKNAKPPKPPARKPAATSSSAGSTIAEADLPIAKDNTEALHKQITELAAVRDDLHLQLHKPMDLGNGKLSTAARTANETVNAHARELRTTEETAINAIAKMKAVRAHAHGFAELMLPPRGLRKSPRPHRVLDRIQRPPRRRRDRQCRLGRQEEEAVGQLCRGLRHRRVR